MAEFKFTKDKFLKRIWLGAKVFYFEMPENDRGGVHTLKSDEEFEKLIFSDKNFNAMGVDSVLINGIVPIIFGVSDKTDEEICEFVAECASKCTFE